MATILEFRTAPAIRAVSADSHPAGSAELIFFPGVRYERAASSKAPRARGKRGKVHHDRLDLPDQD